MSIIQHAHQSLLASHRPLVSRVWDDVDWLLAVRAQPLVISGLAFVKTLATMAYSLTMYDARYEPPPNGCRMRAAARRPISAVIVSSCSQQVAPIRRERTFGIMG